jgi:hypothetical protein
MEEEKKVVIDPLPENPPSSSKENLPSKENPSRKKKIGRPRIHPIKEKVETHVMTEARKKGLEKARAVRLAKKHEREKAAKMQKQASLTVPAQATQGSHYDPSIDLNASMAQSADSFQPNMGAPQAYMPVYGQPEAPVIGQQIDRLSRVETLLGQLLATQNVQNYAPQNVVPEPVRIVEQHQHSVFNKNPYLTRRFGSAKPAQ